MARQKEHPLHWITFTGTSPYETLNSLWACLRDKGPSLERLTVLQDRNAPPQHPSIATRLEAILKAHSASIPIQVLECDLHNPELFMQTLSAFFDTGIKEGERLVLDLSATLPAHIPVACTQSANAHPNTLLLYLHYSRPSFREDPLVLAPRSVRQLFHLQGKAPQPFEFPAPPSPLPLSEPKRQTWYLRPVELMLLINAFLDLGYDRNLQIRLPLLDDLPLCRLHFRDQDVLLTDLIQPKDYHKRQHRLARSLPPRTRGQIPDHKTLVQLFYAAGALQPSGLSQLIEEVQAIGSRPLDEGGDVYHIALDTNLLRDRFFTACLSTLRLPPNIDFVLCETVRSELLNRQEKIKDDLLDAMMPLGRDLVGELFHNQNQLEDRLRYIGLLEFNRMRAATGCHEQDGQSAHSSARNDRYILDAYSSFVGVGCKVLFLSRDQETIRMMRGEEGVRTLLLDHTQMPGETLPVAWKIFLDLLHLLAVAYGRLEWIVGGTPMAQLDGVWTGKTVAQWEEDQSRLRLVRPRNPEDLEDHLNLHRSIQRDHLALKALSAL